MVHCGSNQWFKSRDSAWILNRLMVEHRGVGSCWRWWEKRILNQSTWISRNGLKIGAAKSVHLSYLDDPTFMLESHFWRGKTGVYLRWLTTTPMRVLFTSNEFRWPCRQIFLKPWPSKWLASFLQNWMPSFCYLDVSEIRKWQLQYGNSWWISGFRDLPFARFSDNPLVHHLKRTWKNNF